MFQQLLKQFRELKSQHALELIGKAIYSIRWGMIPMYMGLWIAIVGYNVQFFIEGWNFFTHLHDSNQWLLFLINALDMTMIGNLVVMVTTGGYSTFVREYMPDELGHMPRWMQGLTSTSLKIKMGMSLAAVSGVHLLRTFVNMNEEPYNAQTVQLQIVIHVIFLISFLAYAVYEKFLHPGNHDDHSHAAAVPTPTHETTEGSHDASDHHAR